MQPDELLAAHAAQLLLMNARLTAEVERLKAQLAPAAPPPAPDAPAA